MDVAQAHAGRQLLDVRQSWIRRLVLIVVVCILSAGPGCKVTDPPGFGLLVVGVRTILPSTPTVLSGGAGETLDGLTGLDLIVTRVDVVHRTVANDPSTERIITVDSATQQLQLSGTLTDTSARMLATLSVPVGFVSEIRFVTSGISITLRGATYDVKLPSGSNTGLKVTPVDGVPFEIDDGQRTGARALFHPFDQLIRNKGQGFMMKPTMLAEHVAVEQLSALIIDRLIVGFKPGTTTSEVASINSGIGTTILDTWAPTNLYLLHLPTSTTLEDAITYYSGQSDVDAVSPDLVLSMAGSRVPCASGFQSSGPFTMANFPNAWGISTGSKKTRIAIIDSGFDLTRRNLLSNWTFNTDEAFAKPYTTNFQWTDFSGVTSLASIPDINQDGLDWEDLNVYFLNQGYPRPLDTVSLWPNPTNNLDVANFGPAGSIFDSYDDQFDPEDVLCWGKQCAPGQLSGGNGHDADGDLLADDFVGFDLAEYDNNPQYSLTGDLTWDYHGTWVASVLGAKGKESNCSTANDDVVAGAMWDVQMVPYKIGKPIYDGAGVVSFYSAIEAMNAAAYKKVPIITTSVSFAATEGPLSAYTSANGATALDQIATCSSLVVPSIGAKLAKVRSAALDLISKHLVLDWPDKSGTSVVTASTLNCPFNGLAQDSEFYFDLWASSHPTNQPWIIVGGLTTDPIAFKSAPNSPVGSAIDIAAPATNFFVIGPNLTNLTADGNSFATPLVAGTLGLIVTVDPALNGDHLRNRLLCNSPSKPGVGTYGSLVLDAYAAVANVGVCQ